VLSISTGRRPSPDQNGLEQSLSGYCQTSGPGFDSGILPQKNTDAKRNQTTKPPNKQTNNTKQHQNRKKKKKKKKKKKEKKRESGGLIEEYTANMEQMK
jgi:hypothetical protein